MPDVIKELNGDTVELGKFLKERTYSLGKK